MDRALAGRDPTAHVRCDAERLTAHAPLARFWSRAPSGTIAIMNPVVQALAHDDFAAAIAEYQPTLLEFVHLVEAGGLPRFGPDLLPTVGMGGGAARLASDPLAERARFVVVPAAAWLPGIASLPRRAARPQRSWLYARQIEDSVVLAPDDDDPERPRVALFVPVTVGRRTRLVTAAVDPGTGAVAELPKPCEHGYEDNGFVLTSVCHNRGCLGKCRVETRIEQQEHTVHCSCRVRDDVH